MGYSRRDFRRNVALFLAGVMMAAATGTVSAQSVSHIQTESSAIASAVWAGDTLYVSGTTASPVTPADRAKGTPAVYGNTQAQTMSALNKIQDTLRTQGLTMADVAMMHVYLVGDPANGGKMDFAGMNAAFRQFFGTTAQPNKPARSALQVMALAAQGALVEIEVIAVRPAK